MRRRVKHSASSIVAMQLHDELILCKERLEYFCWLLSFLANQELTSNRVCLFGSLSFPDLLFVCFQSCLEDNTMFNRTGKKLDSLLGSSWSKGRHVFSDRSFGIRCMFSPLRIC